MTREEVWLSAWCAVASSDTCRESKVAATWAHNCLAAYDKKFPNAGAVNVPEPKPQHIPFKRRINASS